MISNPIKLIPFFLAEIHSDPDPTNGTTKSVCDDLFKDALIKVSHKFNGFWVGWSTRSFFPAPPARADTLITSLGKAPFSFALYIVSFVPSLNLPFVDFLTLPAAFFKKASV